MEPALYQVHHDHWADGTVGQSEAGVSDKDGNVDHWMELGYI